MREPSKEDLELAERLAKLTECSVYMTEDGPRIWCEVDLAGPCRGCPDGE